jgi:hypothetical protein
VARRCPIPMSPPSLLMSGPSAIQQGSSFRSNGTASKPSRSHYVRDNSGHQNPR